MKVTKTSDLTLKTAGGYVNIRANLILIHPKKGLLFYTLPHRKNELTLFGGRVKFGETLKEACHRELDEELGLNLEMKQSWWSDHIFQNTIARKYERCLFHEFSGFGVYDLPLHYDADVIEVDDVPHICHWVSIGDLKRDIHTLFPKQLRRILIENLNF